MPAVSVRIPQIGEGLQEARLVAVLKQPGDKIRRDEPIYQMETDKAVMDVESPYEGTLTEWLAPVDTILPIGGAVATMDVADGVNEVGGAHGPTSVAAAETNVASVPNVGGSRLQGIPPRTRAYAKEKGISDQVLASLIPAGSKLMPSDIDAHLGGSAALSATVEPAGSGNYADSAVPGKQRVLNSRMVRGNALVVPGTITVALSWEGIEHVRSRIKAKGGDFQPSAFTMFAFCVAQVLKDFPGFRTTIPNDETYRTYHHANMGIAVALPGDELVLAVVEDCDALDWRSFAQRSRDRINLARDGKDQANESVTISLTNMQSHGLRDAVPVVVPPSVATLFIGEIYNAIDPDSGEIRLRRTCNLALTFDHRVINGVGAANFIKAIKDRVETASTHIPIE